MQELLSRKCLYMQIDLPNYGFLDFLQLFLLGDTSRLIAGTPRQDKDVLKEYTKCKIFSHRGERSFVGEDPLKTTMLLQVARSWENRNYYFHKKQPVIGPRPYKIDIFCRPSDACLSPPPFLFPFPSFLLSSPLSRLLTYSKSSLFYQHNLHKHYHCCRYSSVL